MCYSVSPNYYYIYNTQMVPQDECISMTDVDCFKALSPLISAHDLLNHTEIKNTDDKDRCEESKG